MFANLFLLYICQPKPCSRTKVLKNTEANIFFEILTSYIFLLYLGIWVIDFVWMVICHYALDHGRFSYWLLSKSIIYMLLFSIDWSIESLCNEWVLHRSTCMMIIYSVQPFLFLRWFSLQHYPVFLYPYSKT